MLGADLRVVRRYFGTTLLESLGHDPHLLLELPPRGRKASRRCASISGAAIPARPSLNSTGATPAIRASAKKRASPFRSTRAQRPGRSTSSASTTLERREAWRDGGEIVALRFDPINLPGLIGLGELTLCARRRRGSAMGVSKLRSRAIRRALRPYEIRDALP